MTLLNCLKYAPYAVFAVIIIAMAGIINSKDKEIGSLTDKLGKCEVRAFHAEQETKRCKISIHEQNEKIAVHNTRMNTAEKQYEKSLVTLRKENSKLKTDIKRQLAKDNSCENELKIMNEIMDSIYEELY